VIYHIINMLVYFEPAALCDLHESDLVLSPLPSRRLLWEASDGNQWEVASSTDPNAQTVFGMTANGDLVKFEAASAFHGDTATVRHLQHGVARTVANWEEWCSGMDSMGGLVMLAASLVG